MKNFNKTQKHTLAYALTLVLLVGFFIPQNAKAETAVYQDAPVIVWPQIKAFSAIVYDPISNKVLYEKDADTVRPIASLSKLMTASIADDLLRMNQKLAEKFIKIKEGKDENDADRKLKAGSSWLPDDLLQYMLIGSSNKAADNLAEQIIPYSSFMSLMNFRAQEWGLKKTSFTNPSGLATIIKSYNKNKPNTEISSGYSTAREAALLLWNIIERSNDLLSITQEKTGSFLSADGVIEIKNTDILAKELSIIAGKTGYTDAAGGNLAVVVQSSVTAHPNVIVVLGSTIDERFTDVLKLASSTPIIDRMLK